MENFSMIDLINLDESRLCREIFYNGEKRLIWKTDFERFHDKWKEDENSCWIWIGAINSANYGAFGLFDVIILSHRVSYLMFNARKIPDDKPFICHSCDVKKCVNPNHLWSGTNSDNQKDAFKKGIINFKGENNGNSILTWNIVNDIRKLKHEGFSLRFIYDKYYEINYSIIRNVWNNKSWRI